MQLKKQKKKEKNEEKFVLFHLKQYENNTQIGLIKLLLLTYYFVTST